MHFIYIVYTENVTEEYFKLSDLSCKDC